MITRLTEENQSVCVTADQSNMDPVCVNSQTVNPVEPPVARDNPVNKNVVDIDYH